MAPFLSFWFFTTRTISFILVFTTTANFFPIGFYNKSHFFLFRDGNEFLYGNCKTARRTHALGLAYQRKIFSFQPQELHSTHSLPDQWMVALGVRSVQ